MISDLMNKLFVVASVSAVAFLVEYSSAVYLQWEGDKTNHANENHIVRHHRAYFKDDQEIQRYLKGFGRQIMLWRCRNAIDAQPMSFIDLYCDVIGMIQSVTWFHKYTEIAGTHVSYSNRYQVTTLRHVERGQVYDNWVEVRLRIHNVTTKDSGIYTFIAFSRDGFSDQQKIYVDISKPPHVTKQLKKHKKIKHAKYSRLDSD